ncbi:IPT/TIG domain-containing protein [Nocardioides humilatus]|uniref:IPT/TIG domain-containing protein n=1 Tax=Nocardioides humilatus TaxID=2607660 RepID=UPI00165F479C|nr:IPT/TIG domain-containing protein [Nocardioides humilatus]
MSAAVLAGALAILPAGPAAAVGPTISSVSPTSGATGTPVTIVGSELVNGCGPITEDGTSRVPTVTFAGVPATVTSSGPTSISVTAPSNPPGTVADIRVTDCNGAESPVVAAARFTYLRPTVTGVSPATGNPGTFVTLSGTNFTVGCTAGARPTVRFGSAEAEIPGSLSASSIVVKAPAGVHPGVYDVTVVSCAGDTSAVTSATRFTYTGPVVAGVSPAEGKASTQVNITGYGLGSGCTATVHPVVRFGTEVADPGGGSYSPASITVRAPAHADGAVDITVTDCQGDSSAITSADRFTYTRTPSVTAVTPSEGVIGAELTVTGARFTAGCTSSALPRVSIGGTDVTPTDVSATSLKVLAPPHSAGPVAVTVTDCDGDASAGATTYSYLAPTVTRVSPNAGNPGSQVTVNGTSFTSGCVTGLGVAIIDDVEVPLSDGVGPSDVALQFTVPKIGGGTYDVQIRNCQGDVSPVVAADRFTVTAPPLPKVKRVAPNKGYTGTQIEISGSGFLGGCGEPFPYPKAVFIGDREITTEPVDPNRDRIVSFTDTKVVVRVPLHSAGTVDVRVRNCSFDTSPIATAARFTYLAPKVSKVAPSKGYTGTQIEITGTGFLSGCGEPFPFPKSVFIGDTEITTEPVDPNRDRIVSFTDTKVVVRVPRRSAGTVDVRVRNCSFDTSPIATAAKFTYLAPKVTKVSPDKGYTGTQIEITGTGFLSGCGEPFPFPKAVSIGDTEITLEPFDPNRDRIVSFTDTKVVVKAPPKSAGSTVDVRVRNCSFDTSPIATAAKFTYLAPKVTKVSPDKGYTGTQIEISGSGFLGGCGEQFPFPKSVFIGDTEITTESVDPNRDRIVSFTDTKVVVKVPLRSAGTVDVRVRNCNFDTTPVVSADQFTYLAPKVTNVSPDKGYTGTQIEITGTGFLSGCGEQFPFPKSVFIGDTEITTEPVDPNRDRIVSFTDTKVVVRVPLRSVGAVDVRVRNCSFDTSPIATAAKFTYLAPKVTKVSPDKGYTGTQIEITGTGFLGGCGEQYPFPKSVFIGDTEITTEPVDPNRDRIVSFTDTKVVVRVPLRSAGTVDVRVRNCNFDTTPVVAAKFTYLAPKVTKVSPDKGYTGTQIEITGTGFLGGCGEPFPFPKSVFIGDTEITTEPVDPNRDRIVSFTDTKVVVKAPPHAPGTYNLRVRNCSFDTSAAASASTFKYLG